MFSQIAVFFSKMAMVTFGGAYAVLAYVAQAAVETYGWLRPGEMLDGLGMAETTPGPLIMVVQFVGFMGAFRHPGALPPFTAGMLAGLRLRSQKRFRCPRTSSALPANKENTCCSTARPGRPTGR